MFGEPPKASTAEADVAIIFQQASSKSSAEADPYFSQWHLHWSEQTENSSTDTVRPSWHPSQTASANVPSLDAWDGVFLESTVDWPLQLLFPPEVRSLV